MKNLPTLLLFLCASISAIAQQQPKLVKDINSTQLSSDPDNLIVIGNKMFFSATDNSHGEELWISDGTETGTQMLLDLEAGSASSSPYNFYAFGNKLLFSTKNNDLWISDGTAAGTKKIADILLRDGAATASLFFFTAIDTTGSELWITDGTDIGTFRLKDIESGKSSSTPVEFTAAGDKMFFRAFTSALGHELWVSDGTENGTQLVTELQNGNKSGTPRYLTEHKGLLYFTGTDSTLGTELWKSDGTDAGTQMVVDMIRGKGGAFPTDIVSNGDYLFFAATDSVLERELWRSDGTDTGTYVLKDLDPWGSISPTNITVANKNIFFIGEGDYGKELYFSNGTAKGTRFTRDLYQIQTDALIRDITAVGDSVYFVAHEYPNYRDFELFVSNGTGSGTRQVKDIIPGSTASNPLNLVAFGHRLFFTVNDNRVGNELWVSKGTSTNTTVFKDIYQGTGGSDIKEMVAFDNGIVFVPNAAGYGKELWRSNGNANNTNIIKDIATGASSADPQYLVTTGSKVYAYVYPGRGSGELYFTDGTDAGTSYNRLTSFSDYLSMLTPIGKKVLFARRSSFNEELWAYDEGGSAYLVRKIQPNGLGADVANFVNAGGTLFFTADDGNTSGIELWKSDGSYAGTQLVKDIRPDYFDSNPNGLTASGNKLYFFADDGKNGRQLWYTDGNKDSTRMLTLGTHGINGMLGDGLGNLFLAITDTTNGSELWMSNGKLGGLKLLKDINPGKASSNISFVMANNGEVWFMADNGINGKELWKTNGTDTGTVMVKDINTGAGSSTVTNALVVRDLLYFSADDGINGAELWMSDGTAAGTKMVYDQMPGAESSNPRLLTLYNDTLYFVANSLDYGEELFTIFTNCLAASFSAEAACVGDSVQFTNTSDSLGLQDISYLWYIDEQLVTNDPSPKFVFDTVENYSVRLEMISPNCKAEFQREYMVNEGPTPSFTIDDDRQCLKGNKFKFTNTTNDPNSDIDHTWIIDNTDFLIQLNATKTFTTAGEHIVTLESVRNGCAGAITDTVFITTPPKITAIEGKTTTKTVTDTFSVKNNTGSTYKWQVINGTITSGNNTHEIVIDWIKERKVGIIRVIETDVEGCESDQFQSDVNLNIPASIDAPNDNGITIYPNPSNGWLFIESTAEITGIEIMSQTGQVLISQPTSEKAIDLSTLQNGHYLVKIITNNKVLMKQVLLVD